MLASASIRSYHLEDRAHLMSNLAIDTEEIVFTLVAFAMHTRETDRASSWLSKTLAI